MENLQPLQECDICNEATREYLQTFYGIVCNHCYVVVKKDEITIKMKTVENELEAALTSILYKE